jgi:hypothetical protein
MFHKFKATTMSKRRFLKEIKKAYKLAKLKSLILKEIN